MSRTPLHRVQASVVACIGSFVTFSALTPAAAQDGRPIDSSTPPRSGNEASKNRTVEQEFDSPRAEEKPLSKAERMKIRDSWLKRFRAATRVLHEGKADAVAETESMILNERDPAALGPMLETLGRETAPIRILLDRSLAAHDDELAWVALAERLLVEPEADVRRGILRLVAERAKHPGAERLRAHIRNALASSNPVRVGLGALAMADLGWNEEVPVLIDLLAPVRFSRSVDWVPTPVSAGGGLSMGTTEGYVVVPVPVVGPGVVAYGQQIVPVGRGLGFGGGSGIQLRPVVRAGRMAHPNPAVLTALRRLTNEDFGYDTAMWKAWLAESFHAEAQPPKRVPTP